MMTHHTSSSGSSAAVFSGRVIRGSASFGTRLALRSTSLLAVDASSNTTGCKTGNTTSAFFSEATDSGIVVVLHFGACAGQRCSGISAAAHSAPATKPNAAALRADSDGRSFAAYIFSDGQNRLLTDMTNRIADAIVAAGAAVRCILCFSHLNS